MWLMPITALLVIHVVWKLTAQITYKPSPAWIQGVTALLRFQLCCDLETRVTRVHFVQVSVSVSRPDDPGAVQLAPRSIVSCHKITEQQMRHKRQAKRHECREDN